MTEQKLRELLKQAYYWGRDNGLNRSERNFNDFLRTEAVQKALSIANASAQSEQCLGGGMKDPKEELPKNMAVVLVETKIGPLSFAYYKDRVFRLSGQKSWIHLDEIRGWISISDLKKKLSI